MSALAAAASAVAVLVLLTGAGGDSQTASLAPIVHYTGRAPTGYAVTFRYRNPKAKLVQIEGEWTFTSPAVANTTGVSQGLPPTQWKPGDIALNPWAPGLIAAGLKSEWPTAAMSKDPKTGIWSYTTPLPSGVFSYGFVVNCTHPDLPAADLGNPNLPNGYTGCPEIADPSNPPWNETGGVTRGSTVTYSQVYVPSDRAFHTVDYWWEAPTAPRGALVDVTYHGTDGPPNLPGRNYLAIYTPPGYEAHRRMHYPTLYLNHGYDNNEIDWSTGGDAANILDELIDKHAIKPMVVVMPNAYWEAPPNPTPSEATVYDSNLLHTIIPYVQSHYDVSTSPSDRAFAGLSFGGYVAGTLLANDTSEFSSFGLFSPAPFVILGQLKAAQIAAIKRVRVLIGSGTGGDARNGGADAGILQGDGIRVSFDSIYGGGHDWFTWRQLLYDFLTRIAFKPVAGA